MGTDDTSVFEATADYDQTLLDYYQEVFDRWVGAPFKVLWDDYRGRFGLLVIVFYLLMGTIGPVIVTNPSINQAPRLIQPLENLQYPLGTDGQGRDMLGLMVHATPPMLKMIISGAIAGSSTGIVLGIIAGYKGGTIDKVIMAWGDTIAGIPGLPLLILLAALIEPRNPWLIGIILNIQGIAGASRGIRAQTLPLADEAHVEAAIAQGKTLSGLIISEILPHLLPLIFIGFLGGAATIVTGSVALYFLGVLPFTTQNWGVTLNQAYNTSGALYSLDAAHWLLIPLVTVVLLNMGLTLLAQAFDQVFNPRVRARHRARKTDASDVEGEGGEGDEEFAHDSGMMGGQMNQ